MAKPKVLLRLPQPPARPAGRRRGLRARPLRGDPRAAASSSRSSSPAPARRSPTSSCATTGARRSRAVNDDPNQYLFYTDLAHYDYLFQRSADKADADALLPRLPARAPAGRRALPAQLSPRLRRDPGGHENTLPDAPIVYTLHEYLPICHRDGQMVRTMGERALHGGVAAPLPRVLPGRSRPQTFFMRKRFIQSHLDARRPVHRAERATCASATWTGASRRRRSRSSRYALPAGRPTRRTEARAAPAQPLRVLRPVHPLQGRGRAARGDGASSATTSTATCGSTARTSRRSRRSSRSSSRSCSRRLPATVTFAGPYDHARAPPS